MASLPNPETKAAIWAQITDLTSDESLVTRQAKMADFYCIDSLDLARPYFSKFFDILPDQKNAKHFQSFFNNLLPMIDSE